MTTYRVEFLAGGDPWRRNHQVFYSREEAERFAQSMTRQWPALHTYRVVEVAEKQEAS
jgi:hypothetical protein